MRAPKADRSLLLLTLVSGSKRRGGARLVRWAQAFEAWMDANRQRPSGEQRWIGARVAWMEFYRFSRKLPWEALAQDFQNWIAKMQKQGLRNGTIRKRLYLLSNFYQYCGEQNLDADCRPDFNPLRGVKIPGPGHGLQALMSAQQAHAFLQAARQDSSLLGKRDVAMILIALTTGLEIGELRRLKWRDVHLEDGWLAARGGRSQLTGEAQQALRFWLYASGRMDGMQADEIVFAPLADPLNHPPAGERHEWNGSRPLSISVLDTLLKRYAFWAGLEPRDITWLTVRNTAVSLQMQAGAELPELAVFLGKRETQVKRFVKRLIELPPVRDRPLEENEDLSPLRRHYASRARYRKLKKPHTHLLPDQFRSQVNALVEMDRLMGAEGTQAVAASLRILIRRAIWFSAEARTLPEACRWLDLIGSSMLRLARVLAQDVRAKTGPQAAWEAEFLASMEKFAREQGETLDK